MSRKLSAQLGILGSGVLVSLGFRFVQSALLARLLGVAEFGKFASLAALMAIISRLNDWGLPSAVAYHFRRAPGSFASLMRVIYLNFLWCCTVSLAVAFAAPYLPLTFAADLREAWALQFALAGFLAINTPTGIFPNFINAAGDYAAFARLTNLDAGLQAAAAIGACLVLGPSSLYVIGALTLAQCLMTAVYLRYLRRYRGRTPDAGVSMRETLSYGLRLQWGVFMKLLSSRADILTIGALTNATLVGHYAVALTIRDLGLLPQSVYAAPFQNMVVDRSRSGGASDRSPVLTGLLLQAGLSTVMAVAAALALPLLIPAIYGPAFRAAVPPAVVLFSSVIFWGPAGLTWMTYNAKGRPYLTSLILTASGLLGPGLTYMLVATGHGLLGAAWGGVITAALTFALCLVFLQRLQQYRWADLREALIRSRALLAGVAAQVRAYVVRVAHRQA